MKRALQAALVDFPEGQRGPTVRAAVEQRSRCAVLTSKDSKGGPGHNDLKGPVGPQILCIRDGSPDVGEILKH